MGSFGPGPDSRALVVDPLSRLVQENYRLLLSGFLSPLSLQPGSWTGEQGWDGEVVFPWDAQRTGLA